MRIDAHQHFWRLARGDYGWLTADLAAIHRDHEPADLEPLLKAARIDGTVLVQAAPTDAETDFLLRLAETTDFVAGVVGWADFEAPDAAHRIAALAARPKLLGLRPMIQDLAEDRWMLGEVIQPALQAMADEGLTFDALITPRHLPHPWLEFARRAIRVSTSSSTTPPSPTSPPGPWPTGRAISASSPPRRGWSASCPAWSPKPRPAGQRRRCSPTSTCSSRPSAPTG